MRLAAGFVVTVDRGLTVGSGEGEGFAGGGGLGKGGEGVARGKPVVVGVVVSWFLGWVGANPRGEHRIHSSLRGVWCLRRGPISRKVRGGVTGGVEGRGGMTRIAGRVDMGGHTAAWFFGGGRSLQRSFPARPNRGISHSGISLLGDFVGKENRKGIMGKNEREPGVRTVRASKGTVMEEVESEGWMAAEATGEGSVVIHEGSGHITNMVGKGAVSEGGVDAVGQVLNGGRGERGNLIGDGVGNGVAAAGKGGGREGIGDPKGFKPGDVELSKKWE